VSPPVHENQLSTSNKLDAEAIWLFNPDDLRTHLGLHIGGRTLLEQVAVQRWLTVLDRVPPVVATPISLPTVVGAYFIRWNEKSDIQKVVSTQLTFDVINHSLGATSQQIAKLTPGLILYGEVLVIAAFPVLKFIRWDEVVYSPESGFQNLSNVALLCSGRRVKNIVFTSGDGHEWFLESPQVKIMFLLSWNKHSTLLPRRRCESNEMVPKIGFGHLLEYPLWWYKK
jgi:hypothetical protein